MSSTQSHSNHTSHKKAEKIEEPKMVLASELEAKLAECGVLAERVGKLEAFVAEGLKTATWNSTIATELLKK